MSEVKTFVAKYQRDFEVQVHALDVKMAEAMAKEILKQFPKDTVKLLSLLPLGYVEPAEPEKPTTPTRPGNKPVGGGSPGTPVVSTPVLVDQIAKAA